MGKRNVIISVKLEKCERFSTLKRIMRYCCVHKLFSKEEKVFLLNIKQLTSIPGGGGLEGGGYNNSRGSIGGVEGHAKEETIRRREGEGLGIKEREVKLKVLGILMN